MKKSLSKVIRIAMVILLLVAVMAGCKPSSVEQGTPSESTGEETPTEPIVEEYSAGTLVFSPDGVARFYGERNTVTETFTGWETELYVYPDDTGWYIYEIPWTPIARNVLHVVIEEGVSPAHTDCWFWDCENLSSVKILNGITHLDISTFSGCAKLTSISIPNSVTSIGDAAFASCGQLNDITIAESVTHIGLRAFDSCHELKNITIPNSVTSIGEFAFSHCENLTTVTLSENLTDIAPSLFEQCKSLNSVVIPEGVTSIGDLAFNDCDSLSDLTLPSSITYIGESVFYSCKVLDYLYFAGTMAQWEAIEKHELWLGGSHIAHIYCSDGVISME